MAEKQLSGAAAWLIHTSIDDASSSLALAKPDSLGAIKEALEYEESNGKWKRATMIRLLKRHIKRLEKET